MDPIATAVLVLIGIAIGFLLSALVTSIRKGPVADTDVQVPPTTSRQDDEVRLSRNPSSHRLQVEAGGKVFQSGGELDGARREQLAGYVEELESWLGGPKVTGRPTEPAPPGRVVHASRSVPARQAPQVSIDEPEGRNLNPFKIFSRVFQPTGKATGESGSESIVAQIDALLQTRLEGTHLAGRGIRLVETPGQGITVEVGVERYATIEDVPDPEVQAAIRQAVADWEASVRGK